MVTKTQYISSGDPLFTPPDHLLHNPTLSPLHAKCPMLLLHISNSTGIHAHNSLSTLPPPPSIHPYDWPNWQAPKGFMRASQHCMRASPSGTLPAPTLLDVTSLYPCSQPLKWSQTRAYFTDGSAQSFGQQTHTGAAFYQTHQPLGSPFRIHTVNPAGHRETNTITRAELAAIIAALMHTSTISHPLPHLTIFTDSLASIQLINRVLHEPHTLTECKHVPMLLIIRTLLLTRAATGLTTHIQKVVSHSGIIGNELADIGALQARSSPETTDYNLSDIDNQYLASRPAWPCLLQPPPSAHLNHLEQDLPWFTPDLTTSITRHITSTCPHVTDGPAKNNGDKLYRKIMAQNSVSLPHYNNLYWNSRPWHIIRKVLQVRTNTLWTAARAHKCNTPYRTAAGPHTTPYCPLCSPSVPLITPPRDTPGHILGSCSHPDMQKIYISRHNKAVRHIQRRLQLGSLSGNFTVMDACATSCLPPGVYSTRLPKWLFSPSFDESTRVRLRPDILIIEGFPLTTFREHQPDLEALNPAGLAFLADLRHHAKIHIIEVGYTSDTSYADSLSRKQSQHNHLASHLLSAGWTLASSVPPPHVPISSQPPHVPHTTHALDQPSPPTDPLPPQQPNNIPDLSHHIHIILLSSSGVIFQPTDSILSILGLSKTEIDHLLRSLHSQNHGSSNHNKIETQIGTGSAHLLIPTHPVQSFSSCSPLSS